MNEGAGFTGAGTRYDEQRRVAVTGRCGLGGIERRACGVATWGRDREMERNMNSRRVGHAGQHTVNAAVRVPSNRSKAEHFVYRITETCQFGDGN